MGARVGVWPGAAVGAGVGVAPVVAGLDAVGLGALVAGAFVAAGTEGTRHPLARISDPSCPWGPIAPRLRPATWMVDWPRVKVTEGMMSPLWCPWPLTSELAATVITRYDPLPT